MLSTAIVWPDSQRRAAFEQWLAAITARIDADWFVIGTMGGFVVGLGFQWSGEDGPGLPSGDGNLDCLEPEASDVGETLHFPG